ncbi:hypothetical protein F8M41_001300 [Gigaspora margarita]|uniref:Uncharacterized protein n=1 Tax=Gigaspora margarita TaxID=4874 RepID=A0A8H4B512_GIGMA|nr:hypothetical protein F8M41_001300 [Gigaspora margarita]
MSKRTSSGQIKANSQVDSSDLQEESSTPQVKELTVQELIVLKNWELANYIADKAYAQLITKLEERHEFMNYLKELYELQVTEYEKIEREFGYIEAISPNRKFLIMHLNEHMLKKNPFTIAKNAMHFNDSKSATHVKINFISKRF